MAVGDVHAHADAEPPDAGDRDRDVQDRDRDEREERSDPADDREQRQLVVRGSAPFRVRGTAARGRARRTRSRMTERCAIVNDSIAPNAYMFAEEVRLARDQREARDPAEQDDPDPRRPEARVQPAQRVGHLTVQPHRVDEPRDADDPGVRGDEQDRRREQSDVDLPGVLERPEVKVLDDSEHRIAGEAALVLADPEQRLAALPPACT